MTDDLKRAIAPTEDIINEARNGRMFILVDHEDRLESQFAGPTLQGVLASSALPVVSNLLK